MKTYISGTLTVKPVKEETYGSMIAHDSSQGKECVLLEAEIGQEAYLAVKVDEPYNKWHRIRTSPVKSCGYVNDEYYVIGTENSMYTIDLKGERNDKR